MRNESDKGEGYDAERAPDAPAPFEVTPSKIALAAVDWTVAPREKGPRGRTYYDHGFDPFFADVAAAAEAEDCDTVVYSLWSHDLRRMKALDEARLFGSTKVQNVVLEVLDGRDGRIEVWRRGVAPHRFRQRFTRSTSPVSSKQAFMDGLPARTFGTTLLMACGETNIVSTRRGSTEIVDPFGFLPWLRKSPTTLILNPSHDYMRRPEMREKRRLYSKGGRTVLSVWNRGNKPPEAAVPWLAFAGGKEITDRIHEVDFPATKEIRLGVFEVGAG